MSDQHELIFFFENNWQFLHQQLNGFSNNYPLKRVLHQDSERKLRGACQSRRQLIHMFNQKKVNMEGKT